MITFPELKNDLLLKAAKGESVQKTPVWIMRQAGRYLPEMRAENEFFKICQTPELACEITLQPIRRFAGLFDASIIFSDILVVPQALGMEVLMVPKQGPKFTDPLNTPEDLKKLKVNVNVKETLKYVFDAITVTRKALEGQVPLIGFSGAPWTLMAYMIEGGGSKTFSKAKRWLLEHESHSVSLLNQITDLIIDYCVGQVEAGAQLLQIFDSWAGELSPGHFQQFALPSLKRIAVEVKRKCREQSLPVVPMTLFAKGAFSSFEHVLNSEYDVFGVDWTMDVSQVKKICSDVISKGIRKRVTLQGNLDPVMLFAPDEVLTAETEKMITSFLTPKCDEISYICNLGHGIQPEANPEKVRVFLETVKRVSERILK